jgi:hypothetical protein
LDWRWSFAVYVNNDGKEKNSLLSPFGFFFIILARHQKRKKRVGREEKIGKEKKNNKGEGPL